MDSLCRINVWPAQWHSYKQCRMLLQKTCYCWLPEWGEFNHLEAGKYLFTFKLKNQVWPPLSREEMSLNLCDGHAHAKTRSNTQAHAKLYFPQFKFFCHPLCLESAKIYGLHCFHCIEVLFIGVVFLAIWLGTRWRKWLSFYKTKLSEQQAGFVSPGAYINPSPAC